MTRRATVVGSGPNGLVAAATLARAGYEVVVKEASADAGGGTRTLPGPLPGFVADVGSAVHPAAASSPFFRAFGLADRIDWITPDASFAHPLDDGRAGIAWRDLDRTVAGLGADGAAWRRLLGPLGAHLDGLVDLTANQLFRLPRDPLTVARFGLRTLVHGTTLGRRAFRTPEAAALVTGVIAHANSALPAPAAAAAGLFLLAHTHTTGWVYPRGGAGRIADALIAELERRGGVVETGQRVDDLASLDWGDPHRGDLLVLAGTPRLALTHPDIPPAYARAIRRYRYGAAAAKVDFALDGPVPWRNPEVGLSPTVHLGGTRAEIEAAETEVAHGRVPAQPYVLAVQPSVLDDTRAPAGSAALWTYTHVPPDSPIDPTEAIIRQIERFAPGFRDRILGHRVVTAADRAASNPSDIGGDILGGALTLLQTVRRPVISPTPWRTPMRGVYLASAATPPGPGVTGMPGALAARQALHDTP